jgi:carbamoylphosphate synthase large subunit
MSHTCAAHTVLLGAAGTGAAFAAACSLRRHWSRAVNIIAMDTNPPHLVTTSLLSDRFEQVPASASPEFAGCLKKIVSRYSIDTYLPLLPIEIALSSDLLARGVLPKGMGLLAPSTRGSALCGDKWSLVQALRGQGIAVPMTTLASHPFPSEWYFLKPRSGFGSRGVARVAAEDLDAATAGRPDSWIVQEPCETPEITVDAFCCAAISRSICRERIEVKSGVATKCRLFKDARLHECARAIAALLGFEGSFCFQVMHSRTKWVVTDVNPRPGAGSAMCNVTGNDFFAASFARAWGQDVESFFTPLDEDVYVTRQYAEYAMGRATS